MDSEEFSSTAGLTQSEVVQFLGEFFSFTKPAKYCPQKAPGLGLSIPLSHGGPSISL